MGLDHESAQCLSARFSCVSGANSRTISWPGRFCSRGVQLHQFLVPGLSHTPEGLPSESGPQEAFVPALLALALGGAPCDAQLEIALGIDTEPTNSIGLPRGQKYGPSETVAEVSWWKGLMPMNSI